MFGIWGVFVSFLLVLALLSVILAGSGLPLEIALIGAISVLSNIGPLYDLVTNGTEGFSDFAAGLKYVLSFGMIVGRLEVMIILSLFSLAYWRD